METATHRLTATALLLHAPLVVAARQAATIQAAATHRSIATALLLHAPLVVAAHQAATIQAAATHRPIATALLLHAPLAVAAHQAVTALQVVAVHLVAIALPAAVTATSEVHAAKVPGCAPHNWSCAPPDASACRSTQPVSLY